MLAAAVLEKIKAYQSIIIQRHVRPDPDAYGSQAGLYEIITASFPDKKVYMAGDADPSLSFLAKMDDIDDETFTNSLVIVCDTANQARIADQRYQLGKEVIKIDHHPVVDPYGTVQWADTTASSTSELIYEFFKHSSELKLTDRGAMLLYCGIVGDTGRFLFPSATAKTFQYAAELIAYDFDRSGLYDALYDTKHHIARLRGYILQNFRITDTGVCTIKLTKEILEEYQATSEETSQLVGSMGNINGILAWVFFVEEENQIRVRLRSKGPKINGLAEAYNGGGHPLASGATVYSWEEADELSAELEALCKVSR